MLHFAAGIFVITDSFKYEFAWFVTRAILPSIEMMRKTFWSGRRRIKKRETGRKELTLEMYFQLKR